MALFKMLKLSLNVSVIAFENNHNIETIILTKTHEHKHMQHCIHYVHQYDISFL